MAQIPQINNPITSKNYNYSPRQQDANTEPFDIVVKKHLTPRRKWIFNLYYGMPAFMRKLVRRLMDKRMKYE